MSNKLPSYADQVQDVGRERLLASHEEEMASTSCMWRFSCCCYYLFCCHLFFEKHRDVSKENFVKRFQHWIRFEMSKRNEEKKLSVIKNLINLYAHDQDAILSLKEFCRINPDFQSDFRDDLEFFIPQLCSFFLNGQFEQEEQLYELIQEASKVSFFFAHRVYFFFLSSIYSQYSDHIQSKSSKILNGLKENCLESQEKLYLANSSRLIKWYLEMHLTDYYQDIIPPAVLFRYNSHAPNLLEEIERNQQSENIIEVERIIDQYTDNFADQSQEFSIGISAKDIILKPFSVTTEKMVSRAEYRQSFVEQKNNMPAFYSSLIFIQTLTEIAKHLSFLKTSKEEKHQTLREHLVKINKRLPASVYIPFVNGSVRNYAVLHLPPNESRIFQTKERTNFMVSVELFRPDEISLYSNKLGEEEEDKVLMKDSEGLAAKFKRSIDRSKDEPHKVQKKKFQFLKLDTFRMSITEQGSKLLKKVKGKASWEHSQHEQEPPFAANLDEREKEELNEEEKQSIKLDEEIGHIADYRASNALIIGEVKDLERKSVLADFRKDERMETEEIELTEKIGRMFEERKKTEVSYNKHQNGNTLEVPGGNQHVKFSPNVQYPVQFAQIKEEKKKNSLEDSSDSNYVSLSSIQESDSEEEEQESRRRTLKDLIKGYQVKRQSDLKNKDDIQNLLNQQTSVKQMKRQKIRFIKESAREQEERVRKASPFGSLKSWKLFRFIVKANDDVRQEQFAMQLLMEIQQIFKLKKLPIFLLTYEILATGARCGIIEMINDSISIDEIHKKTLGGSLYDFYIYNFGKGRRKSNGFKKARNNFLYSLAGYSLACYILNIKDRHNQNILIDAQGHIIHIDYGFMLSIAPGKGLNIEQAPFKLTQEFVDILGGVSSKKFREFVTLLKTGFMALQDHADKILVLVEMMMLGQQDLPCFQSEEGTMRELKERVFPTKRKMNEGEASKFVDELVRQAYGSWRTVAYDRIQYCCQGIV